METHFCFFHRLYVMWSSKLYFRLAPCFYCKILLCASTWYACPRWDLRTRTDRRWSESSSQAAGQRASQSMKAGGIRIQIRTVCSSSEASWGSPSQGNQHPAMIAEKQGRRHHRTCYYMSYCLICPLQRGHCYPHPSGHLLMPPLQYYHHYRHCQLPFTTAAWSMPQRVAHWLTQDFGWQILRHSCSFQGLMLTLWRRKMASTGSTPAASTRGCRRSAMPGHTYSTCLVSAALTSLDLLGR